MPYRPTSDETIAPANAGPAATLVVAGDSGVSAVPLRTPLPQPLSHGSKESCTANSDRGKPQVNGCDDGEALATHPVIGTVTTDESRRARSKARRSVSRSPVPATMFS